MLERLSRSKRNAVLCALAALVLWFVWSIRSVVNPLLVGYLLAYILHPLVERIRRRGLSHRAAVNVVFLVGGVSTLLVVLFVGLQSRVLVRDVVTNEGLRAKIAEASSRGRTLLVDTLGLDESLLPQEGDVASTFDELRGALRELWEARDAAPAVGAGEVGRATKGAWNVLRGLVGWVLGVGGLLLLVPLYTYYLLSELDRIHAFVRRFLPRRERARLSRVGVQIGEVLANFFRGRMLVCLLKGAMLTAGLWLAGMPYAFLLGMGSGFLSLVPLFGPLLGFVGAVLVGCLEHSFAGSFVRAGSVFLLAEIIEGYVLVPKILGDSLGLHPVVVLFALFAGGAALGLFGVLVALPLTAAIVILAREFVLPLLETLANEDAPSPILRIEDESKGT